LAGKIFSSDRKSESRKFRTKEIFFLVVAIFLEIHFVAVSIHSRPEKFVDNEILIRTNTICENKYFSCFFSVGFEILLIFSVQSKREIEVVF
jgi:hypothetical protein